MNIISPKKDEFKSTRKKAGLLIRWLKSVQGVIVVAGYYALVLFIYVTVKRLSFLNLVALLLIPLLILFFLLFGRSDVIHLSHRKKRHPMWLRVAKMARELAERTGVLRH